MVRCPVASDRTIRIQGSVWEPRPVRRGRLNGARRLLARPRCGRASAARLPRLRSLRQPTVGRALDATDGSGLAEDTIVVLWGDHGCHLGESGMWGKHSPFERALHSPLVVRAPGVTPKGSRIDALVEASDIYPTLVDLCQLEDRRTRWPLGGTSLRAVLTGEALCSPVKATRCGMWPSRFGVRSSACGLPPRA
ncbi:MAG: sulfatase-like hydrolase/transferase [Planctomycetota bacterium]